MTNAEIVLKALTDLGRPKIHSANEVMWQARRNGWQMSTDKARSVLKVLARRGNAELIQDGSRYFFRIATPVEVP